MSRKDERWRVPPRGVDGDVGMGAGMGAARDEWAADPLFGPGADACERLGRATFARADAAWVGIGQSAEIGGVHTRPPVAVSDEERVARALLSAVVEPAEPRLGAAIERFGAVDVAERLRAGAVEVPGATALRMRMEGRDGARELEAGAAAGAVFLCPGDEDWPQMLDELGLVRPVGLWVRGAAWLGTALVRSVSIVGSRVATPYGIHVAQDLAFGVAERGLAVVSGLALGIDVAAHRGAMTASGFTVGVLAGGVDVPYPREHVALIDRMVDEGAVVSESAPGADPVRRRFLTRNRLIAALSCGTVVVEAAVRSGANSTAKWADDLARPLMAVPGPVTSALSAGSNELLRSRNAIPVTRPAEVIEAVGRLGLDLAAPRPSQQRPRDGLPQRLLEVLEALPARGACGADRVARECGVRDVLPVLGELAALGLVERVVSGWRLTSLARTNRK